MKILAALRLAIMARQQKMDAALKTLGNPDAAQVTPEVIVALERFKDIAKEDEAALAKFSEFETQAKDEVEGVIAARIAAGELFDKAAHAAAVAAAETKGEKKITDQIAAEKQVADRIAANREKVKKADGEVAAAALSDEVLGTEDFAPVAAEVARRVVALKEAGVDPEGKKESFTALLSMSAFDENGKKVFDSGIETVRVAAGLKPGEKAKVAAAAPARPTHAAASGQPTVTNPGRQEQQGGGDDAEKPVYAFC